MKLQDALARAGIDPQEYDGDTVVIKEPNKLTIIGKFEGEIIILQDDELFWNDISWDMFGSEWSYFVDQSNGRVYAIDGYGYNNIQELIRDGAAEFKFVGMIDEYEDE